MLVNFLEPRSLHEVGVTVADSRLCCGYTRAYIVFLAPGMLGPHELPLPCGGVSPRVGSPLRQVHLGLLTRSTVVVDLRFSEMILACVTLGEALPWESVSLFYQV